MTPGLTHADRIPRWLLDPRSTSRLAAAMSTVIKMLLLNPVDVLVEGATRLLADMEGPTVKRILWRSDPVVSEEFLRATARSGG
jgi:hypothetical protein